MRPRSFGLVALAFTTVMVGLHAQMGAVALIFAGSALTALGSMAGAATLILGAGYLVLTVAAYTAAYGTWTRKHWAWAVGAAAYVGIVVASIVLVVLSGNLIGAPLPMLAAITGFWLLTRPAIKAEILGDEPAVEQQLAKEPRKAVGRPAH